MRLTNLKFTLETALEGIHIRIDSVSGTTSKDVYGAQRSIFWINTLSELNIIDQLIDEAIEEHGFIYNSKNREDLIRLSAEDAHNFNKYISSVRSHLNSIVNMIKYVAPEIKPYSIDIKLPEVKEFNEVNKTINKINQAFKTVLLDKEIVGEDAKDIEVTSFENGSLWITIAVIGVNCYILLGKLINIALDIQGKYYQNQITKENLTRAKLDNEILKGAYRNLDTDINDVIDERLKELIKEDGDELTEEQKTKAKGAVKNFADVIFRGGEFHKAKGSDHASDEDVSLPVYSDYKQIRDSIRLTTEEKIKISETVEEVEDQIKE